MSISSTLSRGFGRLLAPALLLLVASARAQTFTNDRVDYGDGSSNVYSCADVGPDGKIYAFWLDGSQSPTTGVPAAFKLIRWNTTNSAWDSIGSFLFQNVPGIATGFGVTSYVSMKIDRAGHFHVAMTLPVNSPSGNGVYYGSSADGSSWTFTQLLNLTGINDTPGHVSIGIDQDDHPHVIFLESNVGSGGGPPWTGRSWTIWHYAYSGTAWSHEAAYSQNGGTGTGANVINTCAAALDSSGKIHVAMSVETNGSGTDGSLGYITNASGSWSSLQILAAGATGASAADVVAITTDAGNKVHIVRRSSGYGVFYHTNASGSFTGGQINGNLAGTFTASSQHPLAINADGDLFFVHNGSSSSSANTGVVRYAYLSHGSGTTWQTGDVMASGVNNQTGQFLTAVFTADRLAMCLFDHFSGSGSPKNSPNTPRQLQYATATFAPSTPPDTTPPTVVSIIRQTPTGQNITSSTTSVVFRVTYSEAVQNVTSAQFTVQPVNGGTTAGTVSNVSGTGTTRDVTVTLTGGAGEFTLKAID